MPCVFGRHPFALKNMAEMAATIGAYNFGAAHAQGVIHMPQHCSGKFVVEGRPAATAVKLVGRAVQRRVAAPANIYAAGFVIPILAGEGALGAFFSDHVFFFRCQFIPVSLMVIHKCFFTREGKTKT